MTTRTARPTEAARPVRPKGGVTTGAAPAPAGPGGLLDPATAFRALASRDRRFDGRVWFGVTTTGIYCRPVCPAQTPRPENVRLFAAPAAAVSAGFRACRRCRPDAAPGSRDWDHRGDLAARALRLLSDGVVDEDGVAGLARRLHVSERHLHRSLVAEVGVGPLQLAISRRAQTARLLIDQTSLPLTEVAFAAGFASVRQFNDVMRREFGCVPSDLRRAPGDPVLAAEPLSLRLRLPWHEPYDVGQVGAWLAARAVPGLERHGHLDVTSTVRATAPQGPAAWRHTRALRLAHGCVLVRVEPTNGHVVVQATLGDLRDVTALVSRVRSWLDLDAHPDAIGSVLSRDDVLRPLVDVRPGLRVPTSVDPFEGIVRAVVGQQVSTPAATTMLGRLVARYGQLVVDEGGDVSTPGARNGSDEERDPDVARASIAASGGPDTGAGDEAPGWRTFPGAAALREAGPEALAGLGLTRARARTLHAVAVAVDDGDLPLGTGVPREETLTVLRELRGVGPWTTDYVALRALGDPDAFPASDLVVRREAAARGIAAGDLLGRSRDWSPWRAYAAQHLWAAAGGGGRRPRGEGTGRSGKGAVGSRRRAAGGQEPAVTRG